MDPFQRVLRASAPEHHRVFGELTEKGPLVDIEVEPLLFGKPEEDPVIFPFKGVALLDTGSTHTIIDLEVVRALGLVYHTMDKMACLGATELKACGVYDVMISIPNFGAPIEWSAMGMEIGFGDVHCIIGMDLLHKLLLLTNGPDGNFTLVRSRED